MNRFVALYMGTEESVGKSDWSKLNEQDRKSREARGIQAWMDWGVSNGSAIIDQGAPLGKTKRASPDGINDIKNAVAGYVIVEAESHEAAARLFEDHPHFRIFPGDSVEIMECLPLPVQ